MTDDLLARDGRTIADIERIRFFQQRPWEARAPT